MGNSAGVLAWGVASIVPKGFRHKALGFLQSLSMESLYLASLWLKPKTAWSHQPPKSRNRHPAGL